MLVLNIKYIFFVGMIWCEPMLKILSLLTEGSLNIKADF